MPANETPSKPLICPACFAREIDPVFLHFDPEDGGEYYCQHCGYTAKTREEVTAFHRAFIRHRYRLGSNPGNLPLTSQPFQNRTWAGGP